VPCALPGIWHSGMPRHLPCHILRLGRDHGAPPFRRRDESDAVLSLLVRVDAIASSMLNRSLRPLEIPWPSVKQLRRLTNRSTRPVPHAAAPPVNSCR
jgi:hypothetical protein